MSRKPPHYCRTADRSVPARFTQSCLSEKVVPFKSQPTRQGVLGQLLMIVYFTVVVAVKFANSSSQFEDAIKFS